MTDTADIILYTRRQALAKLGIAAVTAYVAPSVTTLSLARASSGVSGGSSASNSSYPTPPTPPTAPSNIEEIEADATAADTCEGHRVAENGQELTFSQADIERATEAVNAGYAKPLSDIWADIGSQYSGRVVSIEFTGYRWRPRYRLRSVSNTGRLETVIVSARTGRIIRIVGC